MSGSYSLSSKLNRIEAKLYPETDVEAEQQRCQSKETLRLLKELSLFQAIYDESLTLSPQEIHDQESAEIDEFTRWYIESRKPVL